VWAGSGGEGRGELERYSSSVYRNPVKIGSKKQGKYPQLIVFTQGACGALPAFGFATLNHVHSPHPHHRFKRPGSLALAGLARHVGLRPDASAHLNEPQHPLLPAAPTPRWGSFELKAPIS
jgi:hypothetical protein